VSLEKDSSVSFDTPIPMRILLFPKVVHLTTSLVLPCSKYFTSQVQVCPSPSLPVLPAFRRLRSLHNISLQRLCTPSPYSTSSTMDPTPQQISAVAEELSALTKSIETSNDPLATKHAKAAVVMKAKNLITQVQDPMDACMDHVTNVRPPVEIEIALTKPS
jgi:hypothetical protein